VPPERPASWPGWATWPAISLGLSCAGCSTIRNGWWSSSKRGHGSDGGEGLPHVWGTVVQPVEGAGADAGDREDPELLQKGVAVKGPGQHLLRGDEDGSRVSGCRETAGRRSSLMCLLRRRPATNKRLLSRIKDNYWYQAKKYKNH